MAAQHLAWIYATCPDAESRNGEAAARIAENLVKRGKACVSPRARPLPRPLRKLANSESYIKRIRLDQAKALMAHHGYNASAAALAVGYESPSQFSREFKRV